VCLAVPSKVIAIQDDVATIDVFGARRDVSLTLLPEGPEVGDYVLVHAGFAIQRITKASAESGEIMHESSIAISILEILAETCTQEGKSAVDSVTVRIGKAAGVMPESLTFAFESLKENSVAAEAKLVVEVVPVGGMCSDCGKEFSVDDPYVFACPLCGSTNFTVSRGREMEVVDMELR
jgi:hydrogenase nickel incorporation protein HypA/HybF